MRLLASVTFAHVQPDALPAVEIAATTNGINIERLRDVMWKKALDSGVCNVEEALGVGYIRVCVWEASAEGEERER